MRPLHTVTMLLALLILLVQPVRASDPPTPRPAAPAEWQIDKGHSSVEFKVRHLGISNVTGRFRSFDATLSFDPADLSSLKTTATIDVSSIDTGIDRRDTHLKSDDFFAAEQYPTITFQSTGVRNIRGNQFTLLGNLTMRGVTKPVELEAELLGTAPGPGGKERAGFSATGKVNRMDYGLRWNNLTEAGGVVVSHEVQIMLNIEATRQ